MDILVIRSKVSFKHIIFRYIESCFRYLHHDYCIKTFDMSKKNNYSVILGSSLWLILIFTCSFFIFSCKKKERDHYTIDENVIRYGLFQEGSYWVYKNHATNLIDCTYINEPTRFSIKNFSGPEDLPMIDQYYILYKSSIYQVTNLIGNCIYGYYGMNSN